MAHRVAHKVAHRVAHGLAHGPRPRFCPHPSKRSTIFAFISSVTKGKDKSLLGGGGLSGLFISIGGLAPTSLPNICPLGGLLSSPLVTFAMKNKDGGPF